MKNYNPLYYLLFILLVMGTFASMAQNSYGLKIIGTVAFIFGLIFLIEIISIFRNKDKAEAITFVEPVCLLIISIILGFRVFYIYFSYVELIFGAAAAVLIVFYCMKMVTRFRYYQNKNRFLSIAVIVFHLSIILFLLTMALMLFEPSLAEITGMIATALLICFIALGLARKNIMVNGENLSAFRAVINFKGHSIILGVLFTLFSLYFGLNKAGVLPAIYSDEYPKAYFVLLQQATSGKEKTMNGKYKYQEFLEEYDRFLKDNSGN